MKARQKASKAAMELIKRFEGFRARAVRLEDGRCTIGYGHTLSAREGAVVSEADAEALLAYDLLAVAEGLNDCVFAPLNRNQFDALCAFVFNIGLDNFRRSSVLRLVNEGAHLQAACAMELWRKADFAGERIVIDALVRRRAAEKMLFLTPPGGDWTLAPTPLLRPRLDHDAAIGVPRQTPAAVTATLDGEKVLAERDEAAAEPSAVELAAAAVGEQLQAIFPDEPAPEPEAAEAEGEGAAEAPPEVEAELVEEPVVQPLRGPSAPRRVRRRRNATAAPLAGLAVLGFVSFVAGVVWGFEPRTEMEMMYRPLTLGWVLGAVGIGLAGLAAYLMLTRLADTGTEP